MPCQLDGKAARLHLVKPDVLDAAAQRAWVNRAGETHREPRIDVKAVKLIDQPNLGAVSRPRLAIRQGQCDAPSRNLSIVRGGEKVVGKRPVSRLRRIELDADSASRCRHCG